MVTPVRKLVLLIDGDRVSRRELLEVIEEFNVSVEYPTDLLVIQQVLRARRHDLIVINLDSVSLPMIFDELKKLTAPIIEITSHLGPSVITGAENHFVRPYRRDRLLDRIRRLLSL